jgi:hypothetical protein
MSDGRFQWQRAPINLAVQELQRSSGSTYCGDLENAAGRPQDFAPVADIGRCYNVCRCMRTTGGAQAVSQRQSCLLCRTHCKFWMAFTLLCLRRSTCRSKIVSLYVRYIFYSIFIYYLLFIGKLLCTKRNKDTNAKAYPH